MRLCKLAGDDQGALKKGFMPIREQYLKDGDNSEIHLWENNVRLLAKLIREGKDTVWGFILKNAYRPAFTRYEKVDYVLGNPPWLAYRYVKDKRYRARIKELVINKHKLLKGSDSKLFTQMDTSTLFFVYSEANFLKSAGTIAFVLPKTVVLQAKQHIDFQKGGFTEIHDFSGVSPLFNVRSVLLIRAKSKGRTENIPTFEYSGRLSKKNLLWVDAAKQLERKQKSSTTFLPQTTASYYYPQFQQGATLVWCP